MRALHLKLAVHYCLIKWLMSGSNLIGFQMLTPQKKDSTHRTYFCSPYAVSHKRRMSHLCKLSWQCDRTCRLSLAPHSKNHIDMKGDAWKSHTLCPTGFRQIHPSTREWYCLRESFMIGHLCVFIISTHRHRWKLKFSGKLLMGLTKRRLKTDFQNLPWGRFCSIFKNDIKFKKMTKNFKKCFLKFCLKSSLS